MVRLQASPTIVLKSPPKPAPTIAPVPAAATGYAKQAMLTGGLLLAADLLAIAISLSVSVGVFALAGGSAGALGAIALATMSSAVFLLHLLRMYPAVGMHPAIELRGALLAAGGATFVFLLLGIATFGGIHLLAAAALGIMLGLTLPMARSLARGYGSRLSWWGIRAVVVGAGHRAESLHAALRKSLRRGLRPVGWLDREEVVGQCDFLDTAPESAIEESLHTLAQSLHAHWVILVLDEEQAYENAMLLRSLQRRWVHTTILYDDTAMILPSIDSSSLEIAESSGLHLCNRLLLPGSGAIKRSIDLSIALAIAVFAAPLALLLALLIKLTSPGPAFYSQERIGKSGRKFRAWKFRSMVPNADQALSAYLDAHPELRAEWERDHKLKIDPRITKVGRFLRKTSLDELPQLWNILRGEMSLVGPRPIVAAEIQKYGCDFPAYAGVVPGVTGLWQISGRNNTTYEERVRLDAYYVRNWSPWLDLYILVRTIKVVLTQEGAY